MLRDVSLSQGLLQSAILNPQTEIAESQDGKKQAEEANVYEYVFVLFVQLPISSLFCAGSSWLPLPLVSFSLLPIPNRPCQSERSSKARHEADSFETAEWSERLTPGQSGWLGAAVGSIAALAL